MHTSKTILRFALLSLVCCKATVWADINSILPPVDVTKIPEDSVREVKQQGEQYFGRAVVQMIGKGKLSKWKGIYTSEIGNVRYTGNVAWRETILRVDAEKRQTVTRVEFSEVSSTLEGAEVSMKFLDWDSKESLKWLRNNRSVLVSSASATIQTILVGHGIPPLPGMRFVVDKLFKKGEESSGQAGYTMDKDGNLLLSGKAMRTILDNGPAGQMGKTVSALAMRGNAYQGSVWELVWSWETRDYTAITCVNKEKIKIDAKAAHPDVYTDQRIDDDFVVVERILKRSSMLSERMIFPVQEIEKEGGLRVGKEWWVDSNALGQIIGYGIDFDRLDGRVACVFEGWSARTDLDDENANSGKDKIAVAKISISPGYDNVIQGKLKSDQGTSITTFSMTPTGSFSLVSDQAIKSRYLREGTLSGTMHSVDRRHIDSLLRGVDITGDLQMQAKFTQIRVAPQQIKAGK